MWLGMSAEVLDLHFTQDLVENAAGGLYAHGYPKQLDAHADAQSFIQRDALQIDVNQLIVERLALPIDDHRLGWLLQGDFTLQMVLWPVSRRRDAPRLRRHRARRNARPVYRRLPAEEAVRAGRPHVLRPQRRAVHGAARPSAREVQRPRQPHPVQLAARRDGAVQARALAARAATASSTSPTPTTSSASRASTASCCTSSPTRTRSSPRCARTRSTGSSRPRRARTCN